MNNMLNFTKGFIKKTDDKIVTNFKMKTDNDKIEDIKKRLHPDIKFNSNINHQDRINNLRNLKK